MFSGILRFVAMLFAITGFLAAQVDARLQSGTTDVLDVYFGSASQGAKPEIITLVDNSGSMEALAWDSRYFANIYANLHKDPAGGGENGVEYLEIRKSGSGSGTTITVRIRYNNGDNTLLQGGLLIKPDGTPVTYADVSSTDANKWVQRASHVRFAVTSLASATYTYGSTTYTVPNVNYRPKPFSTALGRYSDTGGNVLTTDQVRVVDIPFPWAAFDRVATYEQRTLSPDPTGMNTARDNKHPQHTYLYDPVPDRTTLLATSAAQHYEIDTFWQATSGQGGLNGSIVDKDGGTIGFIRYNTDYLWWALFGQDVKNNNETGAYQGGMIDVYGGTNAGGYTVPDVREGGAGFVSDGNGLPALTRLQSIKYALIKTYIAEQLNVWWAIRFLNLCDTGGGFQENGRSSATDCYNSNNLKGNPGDRMLLRLFRPSSSSNPDGNMQYIQRMGAPYNTPLTFGLLNTYAQMASTDNGTSGSVFKASNDAYKGDNPLPSCRRSFVIVLSDGNPNDDKDNCSYGRGTAIGTGDPYSGGDMSISINYSTIAPTKANFNIYTLAGVTAHSTPEASTSGWPTDDDSADVKPPFRVKSRPTGVTRHIDTMTIGVSMCGTRTEGAKRNMYKAALYGWKDRGSYNTSNLPLPYDPTKTGRNDKVVNPFFFDAQSPEAIADALALAFSLGKEATNTMSAPVSPLVGLDVGSQMYLGTFSTELTGKPVWSGDLLMAGLKKSGSTRVITAANGTEVDTVDKDSAVWSAYKMLTAKGWKNRSIYTLQPLLAGGTPTGTYTSTLLPFNESTSTSDLPNSVLGVSTAASRLSLIRFMLGASLDAQNDAASVTSITANRETASEGFMMGDIINSTPAIVEFPMSKVPTGRLANFVSASSTAFQAVLHFRMIFVGDNQGILHAFGEVSGVDPADNLVKGEVDELWGFIPPDLLGGLQAWRTGSTHRYLVDGSPSVYLYEKSYTENGLADGTDVLRVMVGLGKGGRSYYCLTLDGLAPMSPKLAWMVRPDESTDAAIQTMGFSSSMPSVARIISSGYIKDVYLVGGGLSTSAIDTAFVGTYGSGTKLGRSVLAFNTYDGTLVKKWDFVHDSTLSTLAPNMGCIPSEVVPMEILTGSNKAQRVYFTDASGSAYALGAKASSGGSRTDTADIGSWELRWIYNGKNNGTVVSSAPAVFKLPYGYPVVRTSTPTAMVPAVGVVFGTGDRNDPMDNDAIDPAGGGVTARNRLVMVLDRQDSADLATAASGGGSLDAKGSAVEDLTDLTTVSLTTDSRIDAYTYLKTKNGYYLNFDVGVLKPYGATSTWFYKKVIIPSVVLDNALFFTTFMPSTTSDICGGAGVSYTYRMCNVLKPVYNSGTTQATGSVCNGWVYRFNDIPSRLGNVGLSGVLQAGEKYNENPEGTGAKKEVDPTFISTATRPDIPRPRAWRIIR